ncbi:MAG TPA: SPOR domain-containing protein [Coleofasciculaceae cyanobacterium]
MRQPASIDPFTPSPETQVPHPVLRAALDNLDVQLEEELIRYRRQQRFQLDPSRRRSSPVKPYAFGSKIPARPTRDGVHLPNVRAAFNLESTGELPIGNSAASENPVKAILGNTVSSPTAQPSMQQDWRSQPLVNPVPPSPAPSEAPDAGIGSYAQQFELSAHPPNAALQRLVQERGYSHLYTQPPSAPEGYLESSEELLKSIEEEDSSLRAQRKTDLLDTLLTPLGIGSMLLLLLSSVTLGYVIMNPATLSAFLAPAPNLNPSNDSTSPLTRVPTTPIEGAPPSPDLAAQEFKDLNLDTLSTLPGSERRSPAANSKPNSAAASGSRTNSSLSKPASGSPLRSAEPQSSNAVPAVVPQSELPAIAVQSAPPVAPAPEPAQSYRPAPAAPAATRRPPASPAPAPEVATAPSIKPSVSSDHLYYVGTDYSGDSSLQQARNAVPDAYVRNLPSGAAKVQMGAFSNEAAAQERVQELRQQGISAQVYQP